MINKDRKFWKLVNKFMEDQSLPKGRIINEYKARYFEDPKAAYITSVDPMVLAAAIMFAYSEYGYELKDYINEIQNLSKDDFGKTDKIYY